MRAYDLKERGVQQFHRKNEGKTECNKHGTIISKNLSFIVSMDGTKNRKAGKKRPASKGKSMSPDNGADQAIKGARKKGGLQVQGGKDSRGKLGKKQVRYHV